MFFIFHLFAKTNDADIVRSIAEAIRKGNATELSQYFYNTIDISVQDKEGTFSKAQAEQILKDFFSKNTPKSFEIKHQGTSSDGSNYIIGNLITQRGNFRVYFLIKNISGKQYLQQLQIEAD
jgi:hypothetical protein